MAAPDIKAHFMDSVVNGWPPMLRMPNLHSYLVRNEWKEVFNPGGASVYISPDRKYALRADTSNDYPFKRYADLCEQYPENPHLQKIYIQGFLTGDNTHYYLMQRLDDSGEGERFHGTSGTAQDLYKFLVHGYKHPALVNKLIKNAALCETLTLLFSTMDQHYESEEPIAPSMDIEARNIMRRRIDGRIIPVLSDPFFRAFKNKPLTSAMTPWTLRLRRKLHIPDPPHFADLPRYKGNQWVFN